LLDEHRRCVFKYLRYRGLSADEANDLTSAVLEKVVSKLPTYDPSRGAPSTWVLSIAHNTLNSHWRAMGRRRTVPLEAAEQHPSRAPLPEEVVVRRETRQELVNALGFLDDRERDLVALKFSALMTNRDIASVTGLTESNVGVILFRALRKLRAVLPALAGGER
jgi:RNA polymerase sigma-70 factor (ECF subfamily)